MGRILKGVGLGIFILLMIPVVLSTLREQGVLPPKAIFDETVEIRLNEYAYASFSVTGKSEVKIELDLKSGPPVSDMLLDERYYGSFTSTARTGRPTGTIVPAHGLSPEKLDGSYSSPWISLEPGNYHLILSNSKFDRGAGGTVATVHYKVIIK